MADEQVMQEILKRHGFEHLFHKFKHQKISPDILCQLSSYEMEELGVQNRSDMMNLRIDCSKYGTSKPIKVLGNGGLKEFNIPKSILENLLDIGFKISEISKLLSVSERTVYRRMTVYDLSKTSFSAIEDDVLDTNLIKVISDFPRCGESFLRIMLKRNGISIPRWRLRDSIKRVDENGSQERRRGRLHRRIYNVEGPNYLWHIDTNHKLVRWKFIIVGGIDGYSRLIMFLKCCDNNQAKTILECFRSGISRYGTPKRVRSDKGLENILVADFMLGLNGEGSMITGPSTHNQRIERLWRDVYEGVLCYFYHLFYYMEDTGVLDPLNELHLLVLHYIFMDDINRKIEIWVDAWSCHRLRTTRSSPLALWVAGQLQNPVGPVSEIDIQNYGVEGFDNSTLEQDGNSRPVFCPISVTLWQRYRDSLRNSVPIPNTTKNHGIDDFIKCVNIISQSQ
ncbi:hypothetical protein FSP39_019451 [Pinctada imbricata]|uniref:Integrase catalytic domain-containing protein n=1 Tax=Pinctada imbricata TaxID=66713 RepID=A0AA88XM79_PINIB|nr:hypothetical protein FSP39_019451 [Pinctada imbricata]